MIKCFYASIWSRYPLNTIGNRACVAFIAFTGCTYQSICLNLMVFSQRSAILTCPKNCRVSCRLLFMSQKKLSMMGDDVYKLTVMINPLFFISLQRKSSDYKRSCFGSRVSGKIQRPKKNICSIEQKFFRLGLWHTKQR